MKKNSKNVTNLGFVVILLTVLGCSCPKLSELANKKTPVPPPAVSPDSPTATGDYDVTMDKYNQIKIGSPRTDVERILGGKGTEISNSVGGGVRFSVNKWEGEKFKSIILSFRNDKVMSKSQVGLK